MVIAIEGVWKNGKIIPLDDVELEENTKVIINILEKPKEEKKTFQLAGAWKDYKTKDGKSLDDLKREIYDARKISNRREVIL